MHYLDVSGDFGSGSFFPDNSKPGQAKMNFAGSGAIADKWHELGVSEDAPTYFVYATTAGAPGVKEPTPTGTDITVANWPLTSNQPWYAVKAVADLTGNGVNTVMVSGSFTGQIFTANN